MTSPKHLCPNCGNTMIAVEAALNRGWINALITGFGSSILQIRGKKKRWLTFMEPERAAQGSYCNSCGSLLIAPSIKSHLKTLNLED